MPTSLPAAEEPQTGTDRARPTFHRAPRPTGPSGQAAGATGLLIRDPDHDFLDLEPGEAFDQLVGASIHHRIAIDPNAGQRDKLEKLCRPPVSAGITRPAIANERLSTNERGQVICKFKQPFRDGTTHVVLDPLDFIARLTALVPRPRSNLTRFHGVFAPNCKHRDSVVP